ncbi:hypothetical protein J43TS9_54500 [Paenibacillus cineris]|nr:hypothetical protein J43TS9_54500 [Paenibacillus cineris]
MKLRLRLKRKLRKPKEAQDNLRKQKKAEKTKKTEEKRGNASTVQEAGEDILFVTG